MRKLIAVLLLVLTWSAIGFAATRIVYENFETVTYLNSSGGDTAFDAIGRAVYERGEVTTDNPSPGSGSKNARARICLTSTCGSDTTMPTFQKMNMSVGSEIYVSFYVRIGSDLSNEFSALKLVDINDNGGDDQTGYWVEPEWYGNTSSPEIYFYSNENNGTPTWQSCNINFDDVKDTWLKVEVYVKSQTGSSNNGIVRVWFTPAGGSRTLEFELTNVRWGTSTRNWKFVGAPHHCYIGGYSNTDGHIQIDDIEIWDGMPTEEHLRPDSPKGLRIIG